MARNDADPDVDLVYEPFNNAFANPRALPRSPVKTWLEYVTPARERRFVDYLRPILRVPYPWRKESLGLSMTEELSRTIEAHTAAHNPVDADPTALERNSA